MKTEHEDCPVCHGDGFTGEFAGPEGEPLHDRCEVCGGSGSLRKTEVNFNQAERS